VDFAHVRSLMQQGGGALMAIGLGEGEAKASMAVHQALHHPLLEVNSLEFATGALLHFTGGDDLSLSEVGSAVESLRENLPLDVDVVLGVTPEPTMEGRVQVILVVTGIGGRPVRSFVTDQPEPFSIVSDNLDVPAFLRKRSSGVPSAPRQPQAS
jgi:cell division protein FtsZ